MSDKSVKFDIIPQLEVILKSIDLEDKSLLTPILKSKEVDQTDKDAINKYLKLLEIAGRPSTQMLEMEMPGRNFDVEPIDKGAIPDYIQIFLYNRKNLEASKSLMELSGRVRGEGLTEDVINELSKLTKSDVVQHEFVDIRKTFIDRYENQEFSVGIPTGVAFIDEMVGGIHKGEITVYSGFAGHCKTTAAVNAAYNAIVQGQNVLYCSFEVPKDSIYSDFISRHSNNRKFKMRIPHYDIKKRKLKPDQWKYVSEEITPDLNYGYDGRIYVVDETEFDSYSQYVFESKFRELEKVAIEETGHGIDVVVIDHIQLLKYGQGRSSNTGEAINEYVSYFRQQAMNWLKTGRQVAFVILSQTNRAGYEYARENNGKYGATAMAEANELERAATLIITVFAETEMKDLGMAKVQILKYRDNRNEDDPTEVNVDLKYYLFGDAIDGTSEISASVSEDTEDILNQIDENSDILDDFSEFIKTDDGINL